MASYAAISDVRANGITTTQADDATVTDRIEIASRIVDSYTGTLFSPTIKTVTISDVRNPLVRLFPLPFAMQMLSPSPPTVTATGTPGSSTWGYQCVAVNANGDGIPGPVGYTQAGVPSMPGAAYNALSVAAVTDATSYRWLRVLAPAGVPLGLLATTTSPTYSDSGAVPSPYTPAIQNPNLEFAAVTINGRPLTSTGYIVEPWGLRLYISGALDVDGFPRRTLSTLGAAGIRSQAAPYGAQVSVTAQFGYTSVPTPVRHATMLIASFLLMGKGEILPDPRVLWLNVEGAVMKFDNRFGDQLLTTAVIEADRLLLPYRVDNVLVA